MASAGHLERGWRPRRLIRELAQMEKTRTQLAREYGVSQPAITQFAARHKAEVDAVKREIEAEFAGLWIAEKANRLAEYQQDVDDINGLLEASLGVTPTVAGGVPAAGDTSPGGLDEQELRDARRGRAVQMALVGVPLETVAQHAGYSSEDEARLDIMQGLRVAAADQLGPDAARVLDELRLDRIHAGLWRAATSGDTGAIDAVLKIMQKRKPTLDPQLLRAKHAALRAVAEELGHLPSRMSVNVDARKATYVLDGSAADLERLT